MRGRGGRGGGAGGRVTPERGRCGRAGGQPQAEARPTGHGDSGPARLTSGPRPEGVLTLRARPPSEAEFVDCFQKTKLAFNLLVRARTAPSQWVTDDTTVYTSWGIAPVKGYLVALLLEEKVSFPRQ